MNMIALYYCYPPTNIKNPTQHASFHEESCAAFNLGGRIRVSSEGINGVLSGSIEDLKEYELGLRKQLVREVADVTNDEEKAMQQTYDYLDIKYCHLRGDIPVEQQMFNSLNVKVTREVVSLFDFSAPTLNQQGKKNSKRCRYRRKQKRKEKKLNDVSDASTIQETDIAHNVGDECSDRSLQDNDESTSVTMANPSPNLQIGSAFTINDWEQYTPAQHLSPSEWNDTLLALSQHAAKPEGRSHQDNEMAQEIEEDAILLDARNVYETRVGHFAVPNLPTFFPNTRKFSSLPMALNTPEAAEALAGKKVFMYCTGGIRCERAGSYLRALSESNAGAWKDKMAPQGIYQLSGGIQKYLESYGENCQNDHQRSKVTETPNNIGHEEQSLCLYRGKNFVFDPRRTDPVFGNGITKPISQINNCNIIDDEGRVSLVGKCIICNTPHDDYDNGNSPCEGKEARCCRCRVLVLVCNECRSKVRCWNEPEGHKELYCGDSGKTCVDEGNCAENVETELF